MMTQNKLSLNDIIETKKGILASFEAEDLRLNFEDKDYIRFDYCDPSCMNEPYMLYPNHFSGYIFKLEIDILPTDDYTQIIFNINEKAVCIFTIKNEFYLQNSFGWKFVQPKYKTLESIIEKNKGLKAKYNSQYKFSALTFENGDRIDFSYKVSKPYDYEWVKPILANDWEGFVETLELKTVNRDKIYETSLLVNNQICEIWQTKYKSFITEWEFSY